jgi:hypothetical protein
METIVTKGSVIIGMDEGVALLFEYRTFFNENRTLCQRRNEFGFYSPVRKSVFF